MCKIGILCAGDQEAEPFFRLLQSPRISQKAMLSIHEGIIEKMEIAVLYSGVCKVNAAVAAQILIDTYGCAAIINAGTAGGIDPSLSVFDTVVSTETAYWDVEQDILTDFHPWMKSVFFPADESLLLSMREAATAYTGIGKIRFGRMVTGEAFIEDTFREKIRNEFSPLSVDMESAAAAHVCYVNHIPFLSIRTITDTPDHKGLDTFEENCEKAAKISAEITRILLRRLAQKGAHH